ncbi:hypothetical protein [Sphingobium sp. CFD-1]|uniref:hypothetical protein n=1 Tax=Sphingobium sp. CFD-1 TaxID=2878545 RepID=UPI00214B2C08|nr:hypothetical protein [Sphingobium sp. CFD-1]
MSITKLPDQFSALEPFAEKWGQLETASERYLLRQSLTMDELRTFHDAAANRLDEIFTYLDSFPDGDLPEAEARLYRTVMGLSEVMQAVEIFGAPRVKNAPYPHHIDTIWTQSGSK